MILTTETKSKKTLQAEKKKEQANHELIEAKKKDNAERRKFENNRKYVIGGTFHKYIPESYHFDDDEIDRIVKAGVFSKECQKVIEDIEVKAGFKSVKVESGGVTADEENSADSEVL